MGNDVDVYFQKCAWADEKFCIDHIEKTLKPIVEKESRFVLFCDILTCQSKPAFRESVSKLNGVVWYRSKNGTDLWQPVAAGYAEKLKAMVKQSFFDWLDDDENADKWYSLESVLYRNVVSCSLIELEMHIESYLTTNGTPIVIAYSKKGMSCYRRRQRR